ncbi:hypothetical protein [Mesoflavibacter sp. SCSIO 43206]|uniref:hypothetical protein n=1 Tax=Mesoflavibacter sp. SCSIO 43206 TaxID=2779362 RepID=UPI001CA87962|nr:hypothetical protein [Mesoflavibacter sp. SCSIO 43206]UAB75255.1 hypothetical protein INR78_12810 [Mesoflavibacter sp. SCSIO 43206]
MKKLIKVKFYKECIPRKGIWYNHSGTIFISVMRKSKPYIRRKSILLNNKNDNELSEWHREWQYDKIETHYGVEKFGIKSYEISIFINGETHRIDNVVKNVALEFQHTLSVDIEEINSRFNAHSEYGFIAYLIIDLTKFSKIEFEGSFNSERRNPLKTKLKKWFESDYCKAENLFVNFNDGIYRIVNSIKNRYIDMSEQYFLDNLLNLEDILQLEIENYKEIVAQEKEKERVSLLKISEERRVKNEKERIENLKKEERIRDRELYYFYQEVKDNEYFKFYKKCYTNPIIRPYVNKYLSEIFEYFTDNHIEDGILEKNHNYYSKYGNAQIIYRTISILKKEKTNYWYSEIIIREKNKIIVKFKWEKGKSPVKQLTNESFIF